MRFVTKHHAAFRVIQGGKKPLPSDDPNIRLRAEQSTDASPKPLTPKQIQDLRNLTDINRD